jgi:hypothetical protein
VLDIKRDIYPER